MPARKKIPGRVISVYGPFASRALVDMPADVAAALVQSGEIEPAPAYVIEAVRLEVEELEKRKPGAATDPLAATAVALAFEMSNPATSATAKSMCAARLMEAVEKLRASVPPAAERDEGDELRKRRAARRAKAGVA